MDSIVHLRQKLSDINSKFFHLLYDRKFIVHNIQSLKINDQDYYCFDPQQEFNLFINGKIELKKMDLKELLSFSLIIESHATTSFQSYPEWSKGEHLRHAQGLDVSHQINPILLAVVHKDLYDQLPLNSKFKEVIKKIEGING